MSEESTSPRPWHLWIVGGLSFLWYLSGAYTFLMAQTGNLSHISAEQSAYYAAQALWFMLLTDVSFLTALIASVLLLLKHRLALIFYSISLTTIFLTNIYELIKGTARADSLVLTLVVIFIAVLLLLYAWSMKKRELLS